MSPHIWEVRLRRLASVNVWLVADADGVTIVDSGYGFMFRDVLRAVSAVGAGAPSRLLLTHGHPDHAGGAAPIAQRCGIPVFAHRRELPYLTGEQRYPRVPVALTPRLPSVTQLPEERTGALRAAGTLTPVATPGHTPGHVAYFHETDRVLLAGDLFNARGGRLRRLGHWYSVDRREATRSERVLSLLRPARIETSHGGSVVDPPLAL